jgi:hypothetical protein
MKLLRLVSGRIWTSPSFRREYLLELLVDGISLAMGEVNHFSV